MASSKSLNLGDHFDAFIKVQVSQGRYDDEGDVVRAGMRLLEEREARLEALRAALVEGEHSGPSTPFDIDALIKRKRAETLAP